MRTTAWAVYQVTRLVVLRRSGCLRETRDFASRLRNRFAFIGRTVSCLRSKCSRFGPLLPMASSNLEPN